MSTPLTAEQKLEILEAIIQEVAAREACYPDADIAEEILKMYRERTGEKTLNG